MTTRKVATILKIRPDKSTTGRKQGSRPLAEIRDEMLATDPELRTAWNEQALKAQIVGCLVGLRRSANLSQKELAERAGWSPAYVSRLESIPVEANKQAVPTLATLLSYAAACGCELGLLFGTAEGGKLQVATAAGLGENEGFAEALAALEGGRPVKGKAVRPRKAPVGRKPARGATDVTVR
ncbi:helix-turn-helix domain-containing protein [Oceanibacterium hippocampi]|uniref:Helix-turn-helix protein n=1 Tax=Oceanibacterium hippocampi TaxID=745714 RepID=A0A1Y5SAS7_9PROT|nr:helix-turn-helix transcriptional regulator [Oceanibacterium hippocampi]SLN33835.1 helix-turn-helix protein [Oceanibacterium hippocampi]